MVRINPKSLVLLSNISRAHCPRTYQLHSSPLKATTLYGVYSCVFIFATQEHCSPVLLLHPPPLHRAAAQMTVTQTWHSVSTDPPLPLNPLWVSCQMLTTYPRLQCILKPSQDHCNKGLCGFLYYV